MSGYVKPDMKKNSYKKQNYQTFVKITILMFMTDEYIQVHNQMKSQFQ